MLWRSAVGFALLARASCFQSATGLGPKASSLRRTICNRSTSRLHASSVATPACTAKEEGEAGTEDFKITFWDGDAPISPWHDVPLSAGDGVFNFVCEIPRFTTAKMEVATKLEKNPIVQDEKKGKLRYYHGPIFWNYGCLPQTWEDPNVKGGPEVMNSFGDNDPLDVVEIGSSALEPGSVTAVKPLGVLSMIDDGELDWKLIAINVNDPAAAQLNDVEDIDKVFPGTTSGIREWFRWYKTPDGKPVNSFGHDEKVLPVKDCLHVIEETHGFYKKLMSGETEAGKLWLK